MPRITSYNVCYPKLLRTFHTAPYRDFDRVGAAIPCSLSLLISLWYLRTIPSSRSRARLRKDSNSARNSSKEFFVSRVTGLDPLRRRIALEGRPPLAYDVASLDVGAGVRGLELPGVAEHALV